MAREKSIAAEPRSLRGKNESRRLRMRGLIPAIVYGAFKEPIAVAVSPKEVERIMHSKTGHNTIFDVNFQGGDTTPAMVVDWQYDPVKDTLLHVDLKRIDLTKRLRASVPVLTQGEAKGVKQQDGLLELVTREIEIECLPDDIPGHFTVDVTELMMGQSIRAGDIAMPPTVKLVSAPENVIAHVVAMRIVEEEKPAEAAPEAAATPRLAPLLPSPKSSRRARRKRKARRPMPRAARRSPRPRGRRSRSLGDSAGESVPLTKNGIVADSRPGQSGSGVRAFASQPRLHGHRPCGRQYRVKVKRKDSGALVGQALLEGQAVLLAKPQTYMNLSGHVGGAAAREERIGAGQPDCGLRRSQSALGVVTHTAAGSAGGHHGMESVIAAIGTDEFIRVRLGINPGGPGPKPSICSSHCGEGK